MGVLGDLDGDNKTELLLTLLEKYQVQRRKGNAITPPGEAKGEEPIQYGAKSQRLTRDYDLTALKENGKALLIGYKKSKDGAAVGSREQPITSIAAPTMDRSCPRTLRPNTIVATFFHNGSALLGRDNIINGCKVPGLVL